MIFAMFGPCHVHHFLVVRQPLQGDIGGDGDRAAAARPGGEKRCLLGEMRSGDVLGKHG